MSANPMAALNAPVQLNSGDSSQETEARWIAQDRGIGLRAVGPPTGRLPFPASSESLIGAHGAKGGRFGAVGAASDDSGNGTTSVHHRYTDLGPHGRSLPVAIASDAVVHADSGHESGELGVVRRALLGNLRAWFHSGSPLVLCSTLRSWFGATLILLTASVQLDSP